MMDRAGEGMVMVARGGAYQGFVETNGHAVTVIGRRRLATRTHGEVEVLLGPLTTRTWPIAEILEIRWQES
jgi:hypothetical protein